MVLTTSNRAENQNYGYDEPLSRSDSSDDESPISDVFSDEEELRGQERETNEAESSFLEKDCGNMTVRALVGLGIAGL